VKRRAARLLLALAALAALAQEAGAQGGALAGVTLDRLRVQGGGAHEAWVSVLDPDGRPIAGVEPREFSVMLDHRAMDPLDVAPFSRRHPALVLTVLIDADLLQAGALDAARELIEALARDAGARDALRVVSLGKRGRALEFPAARAGDMGSRLGELAEAEPGSKLYEALFEAVRGASRGAASQGCAVLLVTRGAESGSHRGVPDVLAVSAARERAVPVMVVLLDEGAGSPESERLSRLAARSGGGFVRVDSPRRMAEAGARLAARLRGSYRLAFRDPRWDAGAERHSLQITVERAGARRWVARDYDTADLLGAPWWRGPLPWVMLSALVVLSAAALLTLSRRRLCRLVVDSGEEQGCSFELYALPVTVGAALGNDLTFPEARISRNHAVLERRGSGIDLVDLNSENGTFVNGDRISRRRLAKGDRISVGGAVALTYEGRS